MNRPFTPLQALGDLDASGNAGFRLKILAQAQQVTPFQPAEPDAAATNAAAGGGPPAGEPQVTLDREGDCITRIKVRCSCGRSLELACVY